MERLQKVIAKAGITSRRKAEDLIINNRVRVNGSIINELGYKVSSKDSIKVDNKALKFQQTVYYLLNKPKNILSTTSDDRNRKTCIDLIDDNKRIYPIGRLDYDSSGLLLLTNDGDFTNLMLHPRYHLVKKYDVTINGILDNQMISTLQNGIIIDGYKTKPCKIKIQYQDNEKNITVLYISLKEGRNRQIKKMMEYYNFKVIKLHRIEFGNLNLGKLKHGEYRKLKKDEINSLINLTLRK